MSLWSRLFGSSYDDEKMLSSVRTAVLEDPMITDPSRITVDCKDGVVTLTGNVEKAIEKDHVEGTVRDALKYHGLKYERIANNLNIKPKETVA